MRHITYYNILLLLIIIIIIIIIIINYYYCIIIILSKVCHYSISVSSLTLWFSRQQVTECLQCQASYFCVIPKININWDYQVWSPE